MGQVFLEQYSESSPLREVSKYGVSSGPYFLVFRMNMELYSVFSPNTDQKKLRNWTLFMQCSEIS